MKTADVKTLTDILVTKAGALSTYVNNATIAAEVDEKSAHTWYGMTDAVIDDINQALGLVNVALNKIKTITDNQL